MGRDNTDAPYRNFNDRLHALGKVAIYNSLIPVIGTLSSCLCLGETFYWKYIIAGTLATSGIYIINKGK